MSFASFIPSQRSLLNAPFIRTGWSPAGILPASKRQAAVNFFDPDTKALAFTIRVKSSYLKGRRSNFANVGVFLQSGVRYMVTCFGDDETKNNGTISTAGGEGGFGATDTGAIVAKIASGGLSDYITATLHKNFTNKVYVAAATGISFSDAVPCTGGRG